MGNMVAMVAVVAVTCARSLLAPSVVRVCRWERPGGVFRSGLEGQAGLGGPTGVVWSGGRRHVGGPVSARTIAARVGVVAPDSREWRAGSCL
jgi:hypothetical protein